MAIYECWFRYDKKKEESETIFDVRSSQEAAEMFAEGAWSNQDMWELGKGEWKGDYAINVRRKGSNKTRTFNVKTSMSPNFRAELVE